MGKSGSIALIVLIGAAGLFWALLRPEPGDGTSGAPMVSVELPAHLSPLAGQGRAAFDANCAACHGESARGRDGLGPPLIDLVYGPDHHPDIAFTLAAKIGTRQHHWTFGNMPAVEGVTDAELAAIIAYIREIQRANGIN